MSKVRIATVWLDGCSGCHMSFLDMDERLLELAEHIDLVYSPLVDLKDFPQDVDVTLVEGAVSTEEDLERIEKVRAHSKLLVSLGDCAVTGNVPAMRNPFPVGVGAEARLRRERDAEPADSAAGDSAAAAAVASGARGGEGGPVRAGMPAARDVIHYALVGIDRRDACRT